MIKMNKTILIVLGLSIAVLASCTGKKQNRAIEPRYPSWAKNSVIYEVNVRQYTPEGTFDAFSEHLEQLKELGVDILWFMPINPIGEENRKVPEGYTESLGSYYSITDYKAVNPEFGDLDDFKDLVEKAHEMGFKVILDWVANHTAWDHYWVEEHPDWYQKDSLGEMISPYDWTDVVSLNYENKDLKQEMISCMKFWVEECDIDGFRCDVAGMVPADFWEEARVQLDAIKPMFMLAEDEQTSSIYEKAFDAAYGWELHHIFHQIALGKMTATNIIDYHLKMDTAFQKQAMKMNFVTNHDENSWNGTILEKFGKNADNFAVLTYTLPGMPLIYSGQEANFDKRLHFFVKDTIDWSDASLVPFYKTLNDFKHNNEIVANPPAGGNINFIQNIEWDNVLCFTRSLDDNTLLCITNLSEQEQTIKLHTIDFDKEFVNIFTNETVKVNKDTEFTIPAHAYVVLNHK